MGLTQITTGGVDDNINIDSNTLKVDGTNNRVGIGTAAPHSTLTVAGSGVAASIISSNDNKLGFRDGVTDRGFIGASATACLVASAANGSERMRIDSSGRLLVGTTSAVDSGATSSLQVVNTSTAIIALGRNDSSISAGNDLGAIRFYGNDGGSYQQCAEIIAEADGTHANNDKPTRLVFSTTADSGSSPTERMRIDSSGDVQARRARSNTAGDVALSVQPSDSSIHYGLRIDAANNSLNLDRASGTAANLLTVDSSGNIGINQTPTRELSLHSPDNNNSYIHFTNDDTGETSSDGALVGIDGNEDLNINNQESSKNIIFRNSGSERMRLDSAGRLLIGTTTEGNASADQLTVADSADCGITIRSGGSSRGALYFSDATSGNHEFRGYLIYEQDTKAMRFGADATERMRIDSSGKVLINTTTPSSYNDRQLTVGDTSNSSSNIEIRSATNGWGGLVFSDSTASDVNSYRGSIEYSHSTNHMQFRTDAVERMRIVSTGYAQFGGYLVETNNHRINGINDNQGDTILVVSGYQSSGGSSQDTAMFYAVSSGGSVSQSGAGLRMYRNTSTNRSINTAGTINASGADYAEYMTKAGDFTLAKGDICGINSEGKLTNVFADAISFVVKSTDPSYVGGDTWHTAAGEKPGGYDDDRTEEEIAAATVAYEEALEAARQLVDRIAFSGQVPVNVTGATPGQHIIPTAAADGSIEGTAKAEADLTMAEYMSSVGKVIAIEDDGRAKIIVKVA